ncbi:MAG TPA: nitroreductase family protein [Bacteroidia bacterium]|nr:nitroreductase family protein [Bacteroidia bacterium]
MADNYSFIPFSHSELTENEILNRSISFNLLMQRRRSIRSFSDKPVDRLVIENLLLTAGSAPSGANKQPWFFCAVADPVIKRQIREAAEKEEFESYNGRMPDRWIKDLEPIGTDWHKPFLEIAPWLIIVFRQSANTSGDKNYYVQESVGIATGILITAIHNAGLCTLTHTPSPMDFLGSILNRPANEKPFLLLPVGYPAMDAMVPDIHRKPLPQISMFY